MAIPGLRSQPFFDDKNRAFWMLQTMGWTFYLMLRMTSAVGSDTGLSALVFGLVSAATGYSVTLVLGVVYRNLIGRKPILTWTSSVIAAMAAVAVYASVDVWVYSLFDRTGANFIGATFDAVRHQSEQAD